MGYVEPSRLMYQKQEIEKLDHLSDFEKFAESRYVKTCCCCGNVLVCSGHYLSTNSDIGETAAETWAGMAH